MNNRLWDEGFFFFNAIQGETIAFREIVSFERDIIIYISCNSVIFMTYIFTFYIYRVGSKSLRLRSHINLQMQFWDFEKHVLHKIQHL